MKKSLIIGGIVVPILVLAVAVYLFAGANKLDNLILAKDKIQQNLSLAKAKLSKQKEIVGAKLAGLRSSFPLAADIQDQMKNVSDMAGQTDFMFINTSGAEPKIIVRNPLVDILINAEKKDINLILSEWKKKIDILSVDKIDAAETKQIIKEAETIKSFISDLTKIIDSLTPENSGLSQFEIDAYSAKVPSPAAVNEALALLSAAVESLNVYTAQISNTPADTVPGNNQTTPSPGTNTPSVVPNDVIAAQAAVAAAQAEVAILQEQLALAEEQIQQLAPPPVSPPAPAPAPSPAPTPAQINPTTNPDQGTSNTDSGGGVYNPLSPQKTGTTTSQGIIIQPGPPKLIQGADSY